MSEDTVDYLTKKVQKATDERVAARGSLLDIREALISAPRRGLHPDNPEGSVTISVSHTLARQWAASLERASRLV